MSMATDMGTEANMKHGVWEAALELINTFHLVEIMPKSRIPSSSIPTVSSMLTASVPANSAGDFRATGKTFTFRGRGLLGQRGTIRLHRATLHARVRMCYKSGDGVPFKSACEERPQETVARHPSRQHVDR